MTIPRYIAAGALFVALNAGAADHEVFVNAVDDQFQPRDLVIEAGDTVRWTNQGIHPHNVTADDGSFRCANGCDGMGGNGNPSTAMWSFELTFDEPGEIPYHCQNHGAPGGIGMAGTVTVLPTQDPDPDPDPDPEPEFEINFGLFGTWFNPDTDGQGALIDVVIGREPPELVVFLFTYNTEPGGPEASRWFIAQGTFEPPTDTVVLDVILATGGAFDQAGQVDIEVVGSMEIQFHDCENATLTYDIDFDGDPERNVSGVIPLVRLSPDVVCEELSQGDG